MLRLQTIGALEDSRHIGSFPVRVDPAHALIFPPERGVAPVAANHEPMEQPSADPDAL